jgi:hypothetical protein
MINSHLLYRLSYRGMCLELMDCVLGGWLLVVSGKQGCNSTDTGLFGQDGLG